MTVKYCDHGAYGAGTFTGYISNTANNDNGVTGTILTVTSCSGFINIGSALSGGAIAANTFITGFTSGTQGGVGVYTVNYSQIVRSTASLSAKHGYPLVIPAWGIPQEGDGSATTPATASAVVSIDMTSYVFSTASTVSIMGATAITCTASATSSAEAAAPNAQYSATLTTMIDNLVTAINFQGGSTTGIVVNRPAGWAQPKIRDAVFARRNGNSLEIMTRSGSADWNGLAAVIFTNVTNSATASWSGGSGGCWGWIANTGNAAIWPSGVAKFAYGIFESILPLAGCMNGGDRVRVRSGKTILCYSSSMSPSFSWAVVMGTQTNPVRFEIDDSTTWSDGTDPVLKIMSLGEYDFFITAAYTTTPVSNFSAIEAVEYSSGVRNLSFFNASVSTESKLNVSLNSGKTFKNVDFIAGYGSRPVVLNGVYTSGGNNAASLARFDNCRFLSRSSALPFFDMGSSSAFSAEFRSCTFEMDAVVTLPHSGLFNLLASQSGNGALEYMFEGCKFVNFVGGATPSRLFTTSSATPTYILIAFRDCDLGNVLNHGPVMSLSVGQRSPTTEFFRCCSSISTLSARDFWIDNQFGMVEWKKTAYPPYCYAVLDDGVTGWSMCLTPSTDALMLAWNAPLKTPRFGKINSLADGAATFKVRFAPADGLDWTRKDVSLIVQYVATDNTLVTLDSYDLDSALTVSTDTWSAESGGQVVWAANGGSLHDKREITLQTKAGKNLKSGTEVSAYMGFHTAVANISLVTLVDPDLTIAAV